jgi:uncharacterized repeat protein (TIGR03803 family)
MWSYAALVVLFCHARWLASPAQVFTTLVDFSGVDGSNSYAALVEGIGGQMYGTTYSGGTANGGTIFRVSPQGNFASVLSLSGPDGVEPHAALLLAPNRLLYGTAYAVNGVLCGTRSEGGDGFLDGILFSLMPGGTFTTMHEFEWGAGGAPTAAPVPATNGLLYGTAPGGGQHGGGAIYTITLGGAFAILYSFSGPRRRRTVQCADSRRRREFLRDDPKRRG